MHVGYYIGCKISFIMAKSGSSLCKMLYLYTLNSWHEKPYDKIMFCIQLIIYTRDIQIFFRISYFVHLITGNSSLLISQQKITYKIVTRICGSKARYVVSLKCTSKLPDDTSMPV
jgi:hypothetical protein